MYTGGHQYMTTVYQYRDKRNKKIQSDIMFGCIISDAICDEKKLTLLIRNEDAISFKCVMVIQESKTLTKI